MCKPPLGTTRLSVRVTLTCSPHIVESKSLQPPALRRRAVAHGARTCARPARAARPAGDGRHARVRGRSGSSARAARGQGRTAARAAAQRGARAARGLASRARTARACRRWRASVACGTRGTTSRRRPCQRRALAPRTPRAVPLSTHTRAPPPSLSATAQPVSHRNGPHSGRRASRRLPCFERRGGGVYAVRAGRQIP
jgi:hypothetical protein